MKQYLAKPKLSQLAQGGVYPAAGRLVGRALAFPGRREELFDAESTARTLESRADQCEKQPAQPRALAQVDCASIRCSAHATVRGNDERSSHRRLGGHPRFECPL